MSAGRLQLYDKRASLRDRTSRLLVRVQDGRELRLREFGTKQAAWVKVLRTADLDADEALTTLGPEAWPDPPTELAAVLHADEQARGAVAQRRPLVEELQAPGGHQVHEHRQVAA